VDALKIRGGAPLHGAIRVSGSKNAALPALAASLLCAGTHELTRVPDLADVRTLLGLLESMGATFQHSGDKVRLDTTKVDKLEAPYDLVRTMRASILVLGPLVARFGKARVSLPGGCAIGARPIDQHLKGLEKLGARITLEHGYVLAECEKLRGTEILFDMPTVTGTENIMLAATLADGTTVLRNAAREPEVADLAELLGTMGARIEGAGSDTITIHGVASLEPYKHRVVADRIEFGTFLVAGALAGESLVVEDGVVEHQTALMDKLRDIGATFDISGSKITVNRAGKPRAVDITTAPYPGFPTDMQAQLMALLTVSDGASVITETIFENRFMHVPELARMGAQIRVDGGKAIVQGAPKLMGTTVMATDLRASACLVLAGLVAEGETTVRRIYHLDRGYERLEKKLMQVGARIDRFVET
jgi:UDP-N-acetylglucosamine 1-carboxyvinyltransferase